MPAAAEAGVIASSGSKRQYVHLDPFIYMTDVGFQRHFCLSNTSVCWLCSVRRRLSSAETAWRANYAFRAQTGVTWLRRKTTIGPTNLWLVGPTVVVTLYRKTQNVRQATFRCNNVPKAVFAVTRYRCTVRANRRKKLLRQRTSTSLGGKCFGSRTA